MIHLIPEWRKVLKHAWSIRLMTLAVIFQALEIALPFVSTEFPPRIFSTLSIIVGCGSLWARFIYQRKVSDDK